LPRSSWRSRWPLLLPAAGLAAGIAGIFFGALYPAPRCGPHDAPVHPYQPVPPHYAPASGTPPPHADLDDDDDEPLQPLSPRLHRHLSADSSQAQVRPDADEASDQTAAVQQPDEAASAEQEQQVQAPMPHRARRRRPPSTIVQTQSSGQVAEIPSQPRVFQPAQ
jgi:hypothetical protein